MTNRVMVFDLDDTLTKEIDFLRSAYRTIAELISPLERDALYHKMLNLYYVKDNPFVYLANQYPPYSVEQLLKIYREHQPILNFQCGAKEFLIHCQHHEYTMGIMTDGRSITQRNKLQALNISQYIPEQNIIISEEFGSEKPHIENYLFFEKFSGDKYYIGDNINKDFISANQLGWTTICILDDGRNIHPQDFSLETAHLPHHTIKSFDEIYSLL